MKKHAVIYIDIDEEITTVFDRLKRQQSKQIVLVVPKRAVLLQSIVNLKILWRKTEDIGKKITLVTPDQNGRTLASRIGIPVYERIEGEKLVRKQDDEKSPLKATRTQSPEEIPKKLLRKKISILELVRKHITKKDAQTPSRIPTKSNAPRELPRLVIHLPNRQAITILVTVSVLLLLFISYIALPGATIVITPKSDVLEKTVNVTLADFKKNAGELESHPPNMIASYPLAKTLTKTMLYQSTGMVFKGEHARGKITLVNKGPHDWPLVPRTRVQTSDGLVFRFYQFVAIPRAKESGPGTLTVDVISDELDIHGNVIGDRGNIGPTRFFLPGLNQENQKMLYGENKEPFFGGRTVVQKIVTKDDLAAAEEKMKRELRESVLAEMTNEVEKRNRAESARFALLTGRDTTIFSEPKVFLPPNIEGEKMEQFDVRGEISATSTVFNVNELLNILKTELKQLTNPDKRITSIDESSLVYRVIERNASAEKIKITATIRGVEQYDINTENETGSRLAKKIKEHVLGRSIKDAEAYLQNLQEVQKVTIKSWPVWTPTMPNVPENITIEVVSDF